MTTRVRLLWLIGIALVYVLAFDVVFERQRGDWHIHGLPCSNHDSRTMLVDGEISARAGLPMPPSMSDPSAKVCVHWDRDYAWQVRYPVTGDAARVRVTPANDLSDAAATEPRPVTAAQSKRTPVLLLVAQFFMIVFAAVFIYRLLGNEKVDPDRVVGSIAIYLICQSVSITYDFGWFAAFTSVLMPFIIFGGYGFFLDFTSRFGSASSTSPAPQRANRSIRALRAVRASIARYGLKAGIVLGGFFSIAAVVRLWLNYEIPWSNDAYRFLQPVLGSYLPLVALLLGMFTVPKGVQAQLAALCVGFTIAVSGPIEYDHVMRLGLEAPTDARARLWTLIFVPLSVIVEIEVFHIFKLPHVASRQLAAVLVTGVLFVPFLVLETIGHHFTGGLTEDLAVQAVIAILIVLPIRWLHERLLHFARARFAGAAPAIHACAHKLLEPGSVTGDSAVAEQAIRCVCKAANAEYVVLYHNDAGVRTTFASSPTAAEADPADVVVPVTVRGAVKWVLVCGPRKERGNSWTDQDAYSPEETSALREFARSLALALHC